MDELPPPRAMPDTVGLNFAEASPVLDAVLARWLDEPVLAWARDRCRELGLRASTDLDEAASVSDRHPPVLHVRDRLGERANRVEFHPAWDRLVEAAYSDFRIQALSHVPGALGAPGAVPEVAKQALFFLMAHADLSVVTGVSMTDVLARVLRLYAPALAAEYVPRMVAPEGAWQAAMFLTERAGGSDVGANEVEARPAGDGTWLLDGDKWFCSNCQADLVLTLGRPRGAAEGTAGLGLYLVPRRWRDGSVNPLIVNRLKDKLGTRGLASGEVTFTGTKALLVGAPPDGFRQMTEMLNQTRVANAVASAAVVHRCWLEAVTHARGRAAFGRRLADHPLMREVLADLLMETEATVRLAFHAAGLLQRADAGDAAAAVLLRCWTPVVKYHTARRAQWAAHESMEARGGNGYIEEWPNARMVRDAHLLSIWEGSGNIMLLDAARAWQRPGHARALVDDLGRQLDRVPAALGLRDALAAVHGRLAREFAAWQDLRGDAAQVPVRGLAEETVHLQVALLLAADAAESPDAGGPAARLHRLADRYVRRWLTASRHAPVTDAEFALLDGGLLPPETPARAGAAPDVVAPVEALR